MAEQRDLTADDVADEGRLGRHEAGRLGSVHVPLRAERQDEIDAVEHRPVTRLLPVRLREPEPARAQVVADEPRVEPAPVPDDHRSHPSECFRHRVRRAGHPHEALGCTQTLGWSGDVASGRHGHVGDAGRHPGRPHRDVDRRQAHPGRHVGGPRAADRPRRRAEGREPAADRRLQDPRGDQQAVVAGRAGAPRRDSRERRQPRPGAGVRRQPLRRAVRHLRAGRRADHEDRGVPVLRRDRRRGRRLARRGDDRRPGARRRDRHGVLPPVRRPRRRRRPGHARSRARRRRARPVVRRRPGRRRRPRRRDRDRRQVVAAPRPRDRRAGRGVRAVRRRGVAGGSGRHARRRDRRQAPGHADRPTRRRRGWTSSSPSTRTPSPTPWCC